MVENRRWKTPDNQRNANDIFIKESGVKRLETEIRQQQTLLNMSYRCYRVCMFITGPHVLFFCVFQCHSDMIAVCFVNPSDLCQLNVNLLITH